MAEGDAVAGHRTGKWRRLLLRTAVFLVALAALGGIGDVLMHRYDPTRILYKRLKAADHYVYDAVDPAWRSPDPASLIARAVVADPEAARRELVALVWGEAGFPMGLLPQTVERDVVEASLGDPGPGVIVDRLSLRMDHGIDTVFHLMHAPHPRGRLIVYHHGFGALLATAAPLFRALLAAGYDVIVHDLLGRGRNTGQVRLGAEDRVYNVMSETPAFDRALRFHIDPVVAGINQARAGGVYRSIDMVGLSMGGFMTILAAAVDPRISRSYPIAADLPLHLRHGQEVLPGYPPYYPPLNERFSRPDLYVLGASGHERRQLQIFNRYDRCCYFGLRGTVYETAVAQAVSATPAGGHFAVRLDETHADHRISDFTIDVLLANLADGR